MDYQSLSAEQLSLLVHEVISSTESQVAPIVQLGHPTLRQPALKYTGQLEDKLLRKLLDLMRTTMHAAPGVGLAAVQIGVPLRIAVLEDQFEISPETAEQREREPLEYLEVINPSYQTVSVEQATFYEGCLSFSGYQGVVTRAAQIRAQFTTAEGTLVERHFRGWQARIMQHETDHLNGVVYIDKAETRSLISATQSHRYPGFDVASARKELNF